MRASTVSLSPGPHPRRYEIKVILRAMHGWQVNIATKPDALEILAQCQLADKKWQVPWRVR